MVHGWHGAANHCCDHSEQCMCESRPHVPSEQHHVNLNSDSGQAGLLKHHYTSHAVALVSHLSKLCRAGHPERYNLLPGVQLYADFDQWACQQAGSESECDHALRETPQSRSLVCSLDTCCQLCCCMQILNGGAPCQQIDSEEEDEQEVDQEDEDTYDEELLGAVAELLPILATALGPQTFAPVFQQLFYEPILKRMQAGQPDGVRSTIIGDTKSDITQSIL